jgi:N-hydroxyarylamine O-acetyltransferase
LSDRRLIRTTDGERHETELSDDADVRAAYRTYFNIVLDRVPHLMAVG